MEAKRSAGVRQWLRDRLRRVAFSVVIRRARRAAAAFHAAARNPRAIQHAVLLEKIRRTALSDFGRRHHFGEIRTVHDFRRRVPITTYEYYAPYIERLARGETEALLGPGQKVLMFALTSGTHSARKQIPITAEYLHEFRRGWTIWGYEAWKLHEHMFRRSHLQVASDPEEFLTEGGIPCGSVSGLVAKMQNRLVRFLYCIPPCVGKIEDPTAKYYTILRLAMARSVSWITSANPSTVVNLARLGDQEKESLIRDIADGTLADRFNVPGAVRGELAPRVGKPNPGRAGELEEIVRRTGHLYPKDYWTDMQLMGNWTGGAVGAYLRHYPALFGDVPVRDIGLIASEGRMTIPLADGSPAGVLDVMSHYFEFIPENEIDSPQPTILEADEVEQGRNYFILLTTSGGLYRYNIYDLVRVAGFHYRAPVLEFLNKGSHIASITGEKLSERQVCQAVDRGLHELALTLTAFTVAPCWDDELPYYGLFVERRDLAGDEQATHLLSRVEHHLRTLNIEYDSKRETLRLGPLRLCWLPHGAWRRFDHQRLEASGGTLEQYKHPCLVAHLDFAKQLPVEGQLALDRGAFAQSA